MTSSRITTDGSLDILKSMKEDPNITLIESNHIGKALALNKGFSDEKTAATAGCLFVKNDKKSFVTKFQQ